MRPNESTPADFATAPDDGQQEDTSYPADKYDAKVMAQKIYNKFGFNSSWTPTDHQLFVTQLEGQYVREKGLQKRIEMVDKALHRHPDSRATLETSGRLHIAVMVAAV
jgi:glycogen synthase